MSTLLTMVALILGVLLSVSPADSTDLATCVRQSAVTHNPPVFWGKNIQQMWSSPRPVPLDTARAYLSQVRQARECYLALDPSRIEQSYAGDILKTHHVEAALLAALRRFSDAFGALDDAHDYLASADDIPGADVARETWPPVLHRNEGLLYYRLGNLSAAISQYVQAYQTTPETRPQRRVTFLLDLGILHQRTQDYPSTRHYFQRAERLFRTSSLTANTHSSLWARTLFLQADLLLEETLNTEFDRAALRRARDLAQEARTVATPGTERYARVSMALSESLGYLGALDGAYRLNKEVADYARAHDDTRLLSFVLLKRGILHVQSGRWDAADSTLRAALARADLLQDLDYKRRILRGLGRTQELQENWEEAASYYRQAVAVVEEYRQSLTASQWSMTAFAQWRDVHRGLVRSLLAQGHARDALAALNTSRARHLQDLRTQARVARELPPSKRARLDSLSRALADVRSQRGSTSLSDAEEARLHDREASLMASRQNLLKIDSAASAFSIDTTSDVLAAQNRVLVSYFLDNPWPVYDRPPRSTAFILTGDTVETVPLPGVTQTDVHERIEAISPLFTSRGKPDRPNAMHFDLRPLHRLHEVLYEPVRDRLPQDRSLTVVPDGPLFHLPFAMLVDSMPGGRFSPGEARFVLHERSTSLELASSLVADTSRTTHDWSQFEPQMAAYGVSEFDTLETVPAALRTSVPEALSGSTLGLPPLPGVEEELQSLRSRFPEAQVALNDDATERAFCRSVRTAGVLHVASHAFVNATSPLQNAILLRGERVPPYHPRTDGTDGAARSSSDSTTGNDGVLFLHELQGQRSRIPMVVLSGCSTARGTLRGGEGMEGLQYAFRAMGAQSTVSTLWPVADEASVDLMDAFYANLQDGHAKDEALRQAQLKFLQEHPDRASPFFWAPPVLYGSPTALPLDGRMLPVWAWWGLGLLGAILLIALLLWGRSSGWLQSAQSDTS